MTARMKSLAIRALASTPVRAASRPFYAGSGVIFTLHRVIPSLRETLLPGIAVTASFLDAMLTHLRWRGIAIIPVAEVPERLRRGPRSPRFACLTFDDGYRDNLDVALPILRSHGAPFSIYPVSDWVRRTATSRLAALEHVLLRSSEFRLPPALGNGLLATSSFEQRMAALRLVDGACWHNRQVESEVLLELERQGAVLSAIMEELFLDADGVAAIAADPLCTVGSHTRRHPSLGMLTDEQAYEELAGSRRELQSITRQPILELAYPFGDPSSCGPREFRLAAEVGYRLAVTTRPGNLFVESASAPHALPRTGLSLHPHGSTLAYIDAALCGSRNALLNRLRRRTAERVAHAT